MRNWIFRLFTFLIILEINGQRAFTFSQTSNFHFLQTSNGPTYIGSLDGLNIFDGLTNKIYRPQSHNMIGSNIQGEFIEDRYGKVWFATYEGLHVHDPIFDKIVPYQFELDNGSKIISDYRVIYLQQDTLWVQAGNYTFLFDVNKRQTNEKFETDVSELYAFEVVLKSPEIKLFCAGNEGLYKISINRESKKVNKQKLIDKKIRSIALTDNLIYLGTFTEGLFEYDILTKNVEKVYNTSNSINGLSRYKNGLLINIDKEGSFFYANGLSKLYRDQEFNDGIKYTTAYINQSGVLWEGVVNEGPRFKNINKSKFRYFPTLSGVSTIDTAGTLIIFGIRGYGFIFLDRDFNKVGQTFNEDQLETYHSPFKLVKIDDSYYFFNKGVKKINIRDYKVGSPISNSTFQDYVNGMVQINSKVIIAPNSNYLIGVNIENQSAVLDTIFISDKNLTRLFTFEDRLYASYNDEKIICIHQKFQNYVKEEKDIKIQGELKFVGDSFQKDSLFISTTYGLFIVNKFNYHFRQLLDNDKHLAQTIYAAYVDTKGYVWCSSNSGILRYDRRSNTVHQFTESDGIQGQEYNTNAHMHLSDGTILFGGTNGLNIFHPDSIKLSTKEAPVLLTEYRINDTITKCFGASFGLSDITLTYDQNTISFSFHAIDYADPQATRVKYQLSNVDREFVVSNSAEGFTRYANLQPGSYTLTIIGSNADQVWNQNSKQLKITVLPPWWQTWWFRILAILSFGSLLFGAIRFYYKQQLAKKDFAIREQVLLIEKQTALQAERTRIAGEMHDDLGGGLTTIKFLSQKVMKTLENENQKSQLSKIVFQSQTLVNNMSEIIWAMNADFDTLDNLIAYSRRYAKEYLEEHAISLHFEVIGDSFDINLSGKKRRNIFLVIKEALHNAVKHSQAQNMKLLFAVNSEILISIIDDGVGLPDALRKNGNGLSNMKNRVEELGGTIAFSDGQPGLIIQVQLENEAHKVDI